MDTYPCEVCGGPLQRTGKRGQPRLAHEGPCTEYKHRLAQLRNAVAELGPLLDSDRKAHVRSELWAVANELNSRKPALAPGQTSLFK